MNLKLPELTCESTPRTRILRILALVGCAVAPGIAMAGTPSPTVRLEACGLRASGYLEQNGDSLHLKTVRHVVNQFRERFDQGLCGDNFSVGSGNLDLSHFLSEVSCGEDLELSDRIVEGANDPICRYNFDGNDFDVSGYTVIEAGQPIRVETGSFVGLQRPESDELIVLTTRGLSLNLFGAEPLSADVCRGDSGAPVFPVSNVSGNYQITNYVPLGQVIGLAAWDGPRPTSLCVGNNENDRFGVLSVIN